MRQCISCSMEGVVWSTGAVDLKHHFLNALPCRGNFHSPKQSVLPDLRFRRHQQHHQHKPRRYGAKHWKREADGVKADAKMTFRSFFLLDPFDTWAWSQLFRILVSSLGWR